MIEAKKLILIKAISEKISPSKLEDKRVYSMVSDVIANSDFITERDIERI